MTDILGTNSALAGTQNLISGFGTLANSLVNYQALKTQNAFHRLKAKENVVITQENENILRQKFLNAMGQAVYANARKNLKPTSGTLQDNLRASAQALGLDNQQRRRQSALTQEALQTQSQINKYGLRADLAQNLYQSWGFFGQGIQDFNLSFAEEE